MHLKNNPRVLKTLKVLALWAWFALLNPHEVISWEIDKTNLEMSYVLESRNHTLNPDEKSPSTISPVYQIHDILTQSTSNIPQSPHNKSQSPEEDNFDINYSIKLSDWIPDINQNKLITWYPLWFININMPTIWWIRVTLPHVQRFISNWAHNWSTVWLSFSLTK